LIALSGGTNGPLNAAIGAGQSPLLVSRCEHLQRLFGDRLYIELQRHGMPAERVTEPALIELAYARGISLVASNEPFFAGREDYEAHDALLCIAEGRLVADGERRQLTTEHRFKSRAEMMALFRRSAGGAGRKRRDRRTLHLPPAHAGADPAAFFC